MLTDEERLDAFMPTPIGDVDPSVVDELSRVLDEEAKRPGESLRLYEPLPWQDEVHQCKATEVLVVGGNRAGKSLVCAIEDCRALTGTDPYGKYPKENGTLIIVAQNWKQVGMVIFPMLFRQGAFKIIKDKKTKKYRAYRPYNDEDRERASETKPAPALLTKRMLDGELSFANVKERWLSSFKMQTGWECFVFASTGDVPMGFQADRVRFDEDIQNREWIDEMQARIVDRKGRIWWGATPTAGNDSLMDMAARADKQAQEGIKEPDVVRFTFKFLKNPFIDDDAKRKAIAGWAMAGGDVLARRSEGELVGSNWLVYPEFAEPIHTLPRTELPNGIVPRDWCRYAYIDPGHDTTAVLFMAVPPDQDMLLAYDELYIHKCNAEIFGGEMETKCRGQSFRSFMIDAHGARLRDIGGGQQVWEQYRTALAKRNVESETTASGFLFGSDNILARVEAARIMLHPGETATPRFRMLADACPNFVWEMKRYRKKRNERGQVDDKPNNRGAVHLCQCFEYMAAHNPRYYVPKPARSAQRNYLRTYMRDKQRRSARRDGSSVLLAPGA